MAKRWIQNAHMRPGALHDALGVPEGTPIPVALLRAAVKRGGHVARMARTALTLRRLGRRR